MSRRGISEYALRASAFGGKRGFSLVKVGANPPQAVKAAHREGINK